MTAPTEPTLTPNHVTILLAEDDDGHADLIIDLLREVGVKNPLVRFRDGQEVLDHLRDANGRTKLENGHRYLLLLDIRMPRVNGVEVLRQMKAHPDWREIPVMMLTTTDDPREVQHCYEYGCNCYITKPVDFGRFADVLKQLGLFMMIMQLPRVNVPSA
jgi:CheY-like chemotaxis protein